MATSSADRSHRFKSDSWRTSSPLHPNLGFGYIHTAALRRLYQDFRQLLWHIEHHVMAARDFIGAPALGPRTSQPLIDRQARKRWRPNVSLFRNALAGACQLQLLREAFDGMRRALRIDPSAILLIDIEHGCPPRRYDRSATALGCEVSVPHGRRLQISNALPILGKERVQHHERRDRLFHLFGNPGHYHPATAMAD